MRPLALLATVLTCAAASAAGAQTLSTALPADPTPADQSQALAILNSAAFAPSAYAETVDPLSRLIERETYEPGAGPVRWMSGAVKLSPPGAPTVDQLRVSVGGAVRAPGGLPLNLAHGQYDAQAYEVALTRDWPAALEFGGETFGVDLTPHAGVGVGNTGGSAEAGATLRLMSRDATMAERLRGLGVRDGSAFGDRGRWYLFAAASGRAVGLNVLHSETGWDRAGWTTDPTSALIGDAQLGVGWRKGAVQGSLGYIHREVKGQHMLFGVDPKADSMVAFSLSIRPER